MLAERVTGVLKVPSAYDDNGGVPLSGSEQASVVRQSANRPEWPAPGPL